MIHQSARIGKNVEIGKHTIIEENVIIGDNVSIGHHTIIKQGSIIGNHVSIGNSTTLGKPPFPSKKTATKLRTNFSPLIIADSVRIGDNCIIYQDVLLMDGVFVGDVTSIRENVEIGKNSIIGSFVMIENNTFVGESVNIQSSSFITSDTIIEDLVYIGPCFTSSNDKYMGSNKSIYQGPILKKGCKIGTNATLLPGVTIGENAVVGAGSVIIKDVPDDLLVYGNPARCLK